MYGSGELYGFVTSVRRGTYSTDDQIRDLARSLRADEREPVVSLGLEIQHVSIIHPCNLRCPTHPSVTYLFLSGLKQVAVAEEERLHLVDATRRHKDKVEDGEEAELQVEGAVADLPECEAAEEGREDVQVDLVPDVVLCEGKRMSARFRVSWKMPVGCGELTGERQS